MRKKQATKEQRAIAVDMICLSDIRFRCYLGVTAAERRRRQTVVVDLHVGIDARRAASSDLLADTVDYAAIVRSVKIAGSTGKQALLECLAAKLVGVVMQFPRVQAVTIDIAKPTAKLMGAKVRLRMHRERSK